MSESNERLNPVVLIPTYNESRNIRAVVDAVLAAADVDVWILDDNSPDGTGAIAQQIVDDNPRVRVTHRACKAGIGRAYLDGFEKALDAGYNRILEMDADLSHPPSVLPTILELSKEYDLVLGSRWTEGGGTENWPMRRKLLSRFGSLYSRTILGVPVRDLTGGFKCFRREVLETVELEDVQTSGYAFQIEMTYRAIKLGFRVVETPITFVERQVGTSKMSQRIILEAVLAVPRMRFMLGRR